MEICTQTNILETIYTPEQIVDILADAGWDAIDWSFFGMIDGKSIWVEDEWKTRAASVRKLADQRRIQIVQAHAPFPSGIGDHQRDQVIFGMLCRSIEVASILGARNIIVHPLKWIDVKTQREEAWKANKRLYESLIPFCEKYRVCVCVENMKRWNRETKKFDISFCGDPDSFCGFIDELNSPYIRACLDVGHAALVGTDPAEFIRRLGPERLKALHIHDVDALDDRHNLPFQEELNWESICQALGETGYSGWFTLEADNFMRNMPASLWPDAEVFMAKTARYLTSRVELYADNVLKAQREKNSSI